MIPSLRKSFNEKFTSANYQSFLQQLYETAGVRIDFRICETPCFFEKSLLQKLANFGMELIHQLVDNPEYRLHSERSIPPEFKVPNEAERPLFIQVDFGLIRTDTGEIEPKLVEIQAFPSLYVYQQVLSEHYIRIFDLDANLGCYLSDLTKTSYEELLKKAIVGHHDPRNVVLLEIDPFEQKTLADFLLTQRLCGVKILNITDVVKEGKKLFYRERGRLVPIERIYNRAIVDELQRKGTQLPFRFTDELEVEWAGHPNWFYRISKFSIPFLKHPTVPKTWFLSELAHLPEDLHNYVLKPLYSFAGLGVVIGPTKDDVKSIPEVQRSNYILQERVEFASAIDTPHGPTKAEIRVMYIWLDELRPVMTIVRMGRGTMMGVDHNKNMEWVGASAALYV